MKNYAIIIGIDHYTPPERYGLYALKGAVKDAHAFEAWVTDPNGGGVPGTDTPGRQNPYCHKIISTSPEPPYPVQDQIDDALTAIYDHVIDNSEGPGANRLYFYFAGHGFGHRKNLTLNGLCVANWTEGNVNRALSTRDYIDHIASSQLFREVVFITDCCRSRKLEMEPSEPRANARAKGPYANPRLFIAFSTSYNDPAFETSTGDEDEKRGVFTEVLLKGLKGEAAQGGTIYASSLEYFLSKYTPHEAQKRNFKQEPTITLTNAAGMVFGQPALSNLCHIKFADHRTGDVLLKDKKNKMIKVFNQVAGKTESIPLDFGIYVLVDTNNSEVSLFDIPLIDTDHVLF